MSSSCSINQDEQRLYQKSLSPFAKVRSSQSYQPSDLLVRAVRGRRCRSTFWDARAFQLDRTLQQLDLGHHCFPTRSGGAAVSNTERVSFHSERRMLSKGLYCGFKPLLSMCRFLVNDTSNIYLNRCLRPKPEMTAQ